jgi:large subunit ribosomal protein L22
MSKQKTKRALNEKQCLATLRSLRVSPRKVELVAGLIRGANAQDALTQLTFSKKAVARPVKKLLQSAIANAENNHSLDIDRLVVKEVRVGRGIVMKRFATRGRGRSAKIEKFFSNISIVLEEKAQ